MAGNLIVHDFEDSPKNGLRWGAAHHEPVDIRQSYEVLWVGFCDGSSVNDPDFFGGTDADILLNPVTDIGSSVLSLISRGDHAGADGPQGLVHDDGLAPVHDTVFEAVELGVKNLLGLLILSLLLSFTNTVNDV